VDEFHRGLRRPLPELRGGADAGSVPARGSRAARQSFVATALGVTFILGS
jgi:hypothetical protein